MQGYNLLLAGHEPKITLGCDDLESFLTSFQMYHFVKSECLLNQRARYAQWMESFPIGSVRDCTAPKLHQGNHVVFSHLGNHTVFFSSFSNGLSAKSLS